MALTRRWGCVLVTPALFAAVITSTWLAQPANAQPASLGARLQRLASVEDPDSLRRLADSVLSDGGSPDSTRVEALYWRAMRADSPDDRRLDLLRLIVEHPLAVRTAEALWHMAETELAADDTDAGVRHLRRIVRDHAGSDIGPRAARRLGDLLLAGGDLRGGCAAYDSALAHVPGTRVEERNRIAYARRPCDRLTDADTTVAAPDSVNRRTDDSAAVRAPPARRPPDPATREQRPATPPARATQWSVQVAALEDQAEARRLAAELRQRGLDARVTAERPYRVRIGRFATRAEATALATRLRTERPGAFAVEAERP